MQSVDQAGVQCISCNASIPSGSKFCGQCGTALKVPLIPAAAGSSTSAHSTCDESKLQKRCKVIGGALALVPFGGMGLLFFFGTLSFGITFKAVVLSVGILVICLGVGWALGSGLGEWAARLIEFARKK